MASGYLQVHGQWEAWLRGTPHRPSPFSPWCPPPSPSLDPYPRTSLNTMNAPSTAERVVSELLYAAAVYGTPGIAMRPEELARLEQCLGPEGRISALERYAYLLPGISPDQTTSLQHPSHLRHTQPMAPIASPSSPSAATQEPFVAPPPSPRPTLMSARALEKRRATDDSSSTHAMVSGPFSITHLPPQPKFPHTTSSQVLGKRRDPEPDDETSATAPPVPQPEPPAKRRRGKAPIAPGSVVCQWDDCGQEVVIAQYREHMLKSHFPGVDAVYAVRQRQQCRWTGCAGPRRGDYGNLTLALKHVRDVHFRLRDAPCPSCGEMKRYDTLAAHEAACRRRKEEEKLASGSKENLDTDA
ncbi:hypothetical protein C8Q77DRAFT_1156706 [Trametes polyzona]|nr:hypothetical protein C8Q77DRAFT_1156706 [Trametes polyzona]